MKLSARGWRRDMGPNDLGAPQIEDSHVSDADPDYYSIPDTYITRAEQGLKIGWHSKITLTGEYLVELRISKKDVMDLFKLAFGGEIKSETIDAMGAVVDDAIIAERVSSMTLDDLYKMLSTRRGIA